MRLEEADQIGKNGALIEANANGVRYAKTTARMETHGNISLMTRLAQGLIAGAKTAWPA